MSAGRLRHAIVFERRAKGDDSYGNELSDWVRFAPALGSIRAEIRSLRGKETSSGGRSASMSLHEIKLRNSQQVADIRPSDRVKDARTGERYNIKVIDVDTRSRWMLLTVEKGGPTG